MNENSSGGDSLAGRYRASLASKAVELSRAWEQWLIDSADAHARGAVRLIAHRLAGSAESYGYPDIGRHALAVDEALTDFESALPESRESAASLRQRMATPIRALLDALARGTAHATADDADVRQDTLRSGPIVLYLDDDVDQGEWWRDVLVAHGLRVRWIEHPDQLAEAIIVERPAVLLVDYWIGDAPCLDLVRRLRSDESFAALPVVCLTVDDAAVSSSTAMSAGFCAVVRKSVTPGDLAEILRQAAGGARGDPGAGRSG